jgi:hypothetical protein
VLEWNGYRVTMIRKIASATSSTKMNFRSSRSRFRTHRQVSSLLLSQQQRQSQLPRRVQPDAVRAGQVRSLCAAFTSQVAGYFVTVRYGANRRHIDRQIDGRRAGRFRAVRQRRAFGSNARRMQEALRRGRWTFLGPLGYLNAPRARRESLIPDPERAAIVRRIFKQYATGRHTNKKFGRRPRAGD